MSTGHGMHRVSTREKPRKDMKRELAENQPPFYIPILFSLPTMVVRGPSDRHQCLRPRAYRRPWR